MNKTKQEESPAAKEAPPPTPLATVPNDTLAQLPKAQMPIALEGADVMTRVRLEPKTFQEGMFCAEIAYKMKLGKVGSVADAMVRIMRGATVGLDAMTSCEQIYVVGDRTGMYARLMHALVLRSPLCGEFKILEDQCTASVGVVRARRKGNDEATIYKFTAEEAKKLVGDKKFNDADSNYSKDCKGMLIAKALTRAAQREWPDVTMGFTTIEDLHDDEGAITTSGETTPATIQTPTRDFEKELIDIIAKIDVAATDEDFKAARAAIADWNAGDVYKKRATDAYNAARTKWKDAQKGEAKS